MFVLVFVYVIIKMSSRRVLSSGLFSMSVTYSAGCHRWCFPIPLLLDLVPSGLCLWLVGFLLVALFCLLTKVDWIGVTCLLHGFV